MRFFPLIEMAIFSLFVANSGLPASSPSPEQLQNAKYEAGRASIDRLFDSSNPLGSFILLKLQRHLIATNDAATFV